MEFSATTVNKVRTSRTSSNFGRAKTNFSQDDAGSACRGAINMRIAQLHMDAHDKLRFEILGKASVKYHLKANHEVEAKRWVWALNNAIRWGKDEAKADAQRQSQNNELLKQAKLGQIDELHVGDIKHSKPQTSKLANKGVGFEGLSGLRHASTKATYDAYDEDDDAATSVDMSAAGDDALRPMISAGSERRFDDDANSIDIQQPIQRDAFMIAAHSAKLQLDLMAQMSAALQHERSRNPTTLISQPSVAEALESFEDAVSNLRGLVGDLNKIARDRESFWHNKLEREANVRRLWEDSMTRVAIEHEDLENRMGASEEKHKRTRRALREALEAPSAGRTDSLRGMQVEDSLPSPTYETPNAMQLGAASTVPPPEQNRFRRKSTIAEMANLSDDDDDDDEEFFDAVDAGEVEVVRNMPISSAVPFMAAMPPSTATVPTSTAAMSHSIASMPPSTATMTTRATEPSIHDRPLPAQATRNASIKAEAVPQEERSVPQEEPVATKDELMKLSWKGYEDPVRKRLKMDADDRPKISLWVSTFRVNITLLISSIEQSYID